MKYGTNTAAFVDAIKLGAANYLDFKGLTQRADYWWWILFMSVSFIVASSISEGVGAAWIVAILLPTIAIGVRRLRDAGYHWAWLFLGLVPIVGGIVLIVFLTQPTKVASEEA
jgi:uncharacterized membrane protein YhaH (DUF805 family)